MGAVLFSYWLPGIALNTFPAASVVSLTDTAAWPELAMLGIGVVAVVISRPGLSHRRRRGEAAAFGVVLLIFLAGNAVFNEYAVKPLFGIPRPNIEELAHSGALGADFTNAEAFYAVGDKTTRRQVLAEKLAVPATPQLSQRVRAHWVHETGYSFPSGHATAAMTLAAILVASGVVWLGGWRRALALFVVPVWAVAVAWSRVLLEVHTATDVVAGTLAGLTWGMVAFVAVDRGAARCGPATGEGRGRLS
jgi:phosphatidylglycerophosphatase B